MKFDSLMTIMPYGESKTFLNEKVDILRNKGSLFGKEFSNHIAEVRNAKRRSITMFKPK